MNIEQIKNSISYCGLICLLCRDDIECSCRRDNHCGKRLSLEGCFQYTCCVSKNLNGCWECPEAPCDKDMFSPIDKNRISARRKLRAFITCIKEDGIEKFSQYIINNIEKGIVYHRNGIYGDYDLENEEDILKLLRTGTQFTIN